jgi:hypothetical protein
MAVRGECHALKRELTGTDLFDESGYGGASLPNDPYLGTLGRLVETVQKRQGTGRIERFLGLIWHILRLAGMAEEFEFLIAGL